MQKAEGISELLLRWSNGEKEALDQLIQLVYEELHVLANNHLRYENQNHSLQPTMIVHEIYLRLVNQQNISIESRAQFFALSAKLVRNILVDRARFHLATKRWGGMVQVALSEADRLGECQDIDLVALDDALNALTAIMPQHGQIIELRFFGGLTIEEIAKVVDLSPATINRYWTFAKTWLHREILNGKATNEDNE